jgi:hypothetical protein
VATAAEAQVCTGSPAFSAGRFRISGNSAFNENAQSFTAGFATGGTALFGEVAVGTVRYHELDASGTSLDGTLGYQFWIDPRKRIQICPAAALTFIMGPKNFDVVGDGSIIVNLSETDMAFGVSAGAVISDSTDPQIIPTASLAVANATLRSNQEGTEFTAQSSESYVAFAAGVGLTFNKTIGLRAGVSIPLGLEGSIVSFGLVVSINFGRKE